MRDQQKSSPFDILSVGMQAHYSKVFSENDVFTFVQLTGDHNPLHCDDAYAQKSIFGSRIVHGLLTASLIAKILGTQLPGPGSIYINQDLVFLAPVRIGEAVMATVYITDLDPQKSRVTLDTNCKVGDKKVIQGSACLFVPNR